jgi:mono/diheme cytochrome c family protein
VAQQVVYPTVAVPAALITYQMQNPSGLDARVRQLEGIAAQNAQILKSLSTGHAQASQSQAPQASQAEYEARRVLANNCYKCHQGPVSQGGLDLSGPLSPSQKMLAYDYMLSGDMPPNLPEGHTVDPAQIAAFGAWMDQDREWLRKMLRHQVAQSAAPQPAPASTRLGP